DFVLVRFALFFDTVLETGETLDQRRAFSLTLSAAAFEFVFKLRPGDEPEGDCADDQTDDQHRHGEDNLHDRSFSHSFGPVSIILVVGASSTAINCVVRSVMLGSSAGMRLVGSSF